MRSAFRIFLLALAAVGSPAIAGAFVLDGMSDPLPVNACLPITGERIVFAGPVCDGANCPPNAPVTCPDNDAVQTALPGVHRGAMRTTEALCFDGTVIARVEPAQARFHGTFDLTSDGWITLGYGSPYQSTPDPDALDLDLPGLGVSGVFFDVKAGPTPDAPLYAWIEFLADGPESPRPSAFAACTITGPGPVFVPLADFAPRMPSFTMKDVDNIQFVFSNCGSYEESCTGALPAVRFTIGAIELVTPPTPATPASWGRMKASYR